MKRTRIALVGDFDPEVIAHQAIPKALELAADSLGTVGLEWEWVGTETLAVGGEGKLSSFHSIWCVPASPYRSMEGALEAIRFARTQSIPFLGTCGGFQHALIEYARNVLGLKDADHAESNPTASLPLIAPLACSLVDQQGDIVLKNGSQIKRIYDRSRITEGYHCRYGLNSGLESILQNGNEHLQFTGRDTNGEVRVFELQNHPFFIGTLFQPERSVLRGIAHPLISAFVEGAKKREA